MVGLKSIPLLHVYILPYKVVSLKVKSKHTLTISFRAQGLDLQSA